MIKIIFYTQPPPFRGTSCLRQLPNLLFASVLERFLDSLQFKLKILRRINVTGIFLFFADKRKKKEIRFVERSAPIAIMGKGIL